MSNGQDPGKPPQKPASQSSAGTAPVTGGSTEIGGVTGTAAAPAPGGQGKIKPLDDDRPPQ
jgi:hypothetical protein